MPQKSNGRILVVSHTPHYRSRAGTVGLSPTVRELDHLATLFEELVHLAPELEADAPKDSSAYSSKNIRIVPLAPAGGTRAIDKLDVLLKAPGYARQFMMLAHDADVVHIRCPANVSLIAAMLAPLVRRNKKIWIKYAGSWSKHRSEAVSYKLQRWWCRAGLHGGEVSINGRYAGQGRHIHSFLNPCLTESELEEGRRIALKKVLQAPLELIFVGALTRKKGAGRALEILKLLRDRDVPARLTLVGHSPEREALHAEAEQLGVAREARFVGALPRAAINEYYAACHFIVHPSETSEGWPKVISEAMAFGGVPVVSTAGATGQILNELGPFESFAPRDTGPMVDFIERTFRSSDEWYQLSQRAVLCASQFSYRSYLGAVTRILKLGESSGTA